MVRAQHICVTAMEEEEDNDGDGDGDAADDDDDYNNNDGDDDDLLPKIAMVCNSIQEWNKQRRIRSRI